MGISHLLQEYWCHSMLHLQLWCLGAGSGLLNSGFKEMNDGEGERNETSCFDKMLNPHKFLVISGKTMILEKAGLFLSRFQFLFHA